MDKDKLKLMTEKFHSCLELEYSNFAYSRMHHISVPTFMLQTGRYTRAYEQEALDMLKGFLSNPDKMPNRSTIKVNNRRLSKLKRKGNIFTKEPTKILDTKMTILDVKLDTPEQYREGIVAWAKSVVESF